MKLNLAKKEITPKEPVPLEGYGDRTHNSVGVHDPLFAYAWLFGAEDENPYIWIAADLCLFSERTVRVLKKRIAAGTGIKVDRLPLSTTHTHSGPAASSLSDNPEPWAARYFEQLAGSLTSLVGEVERSAYSGYAQVGLSEARIGANRRGTKLPIDPRVVLISLYDPEGRLTRLLFHYSCHLTVLGVENYLASAAWVGPVRRQMEQRLGVPVAFLQGAEGNIDPLTRGLLDIADPDQAKGSSFQEMEVLSAEMVQFLRRGLEASPLHRVDTVRSLNREVSLPLRYGPLSREQVAQKEAEWKQQIASFLGISIDRIPEDGSINGLIKAHCRQHRISPEETRLWVSRQYAFSSFHTMYRLGAGAIDSEKGELSCSVKVLDFGPLLILGIPNEVLVEAAFDWQERFPERIALIAGLFDGWYGYLPHLKNFQEPESDLRYETVSTLFSERAAIQLLQEAEQAVAAR